MECLWDGAVSAQRFDGLFAARVDGLEDLQSLSLPSTLGGSAHPPVTLFQGRRDRVLLASGARRWSQKNHVQYLESLDGGHDLLWTHADWVLEQMGRVRESSL